jgi:hypothetical protein
MRYLFDSSRLYKERLLHTPPRKNGAKKDYQKDNCTA